MLFQTGRIVATRLALTHLEGHDMHPMQLVLRHASGDYGDLCNADIQENILALGRYRRILSVYYVGKEKIYVITEADRLTTTVLLASEY